MAFSFAAAPVPVRRAIGDEFRSEWGRLASPGASWTGSERLAIAAAARGENPGGIPRAAAAAARAIGVDPAGLRHDLVAAATDALGEPRYVELVGVVARLSAVDHFHRALGLPVEPLPEAVPGDATGEIDGAARPGKGWVPMVGGASIVGALSLVPAEMEAQRRLHGPIYLTYEEMADLGIRRGLHRSQMELVAARTSAVNECFY